MARTQRLLCNTSCHFEEIGEESHSTVEELISLCWVFSLGCEKSHLNHSLFFFYTLSLGLLLFLLIFLFICCFQ